MTDAVSAYPFAIFGNDWQNAMDNRAYPVKGDTIIGNDVWIGHKSIIMPGVKIGDGSIIATNSTVTKNVEPYSIVGGNPAREIRKRFSDEKIRILTELNWWDWPVDKITRNLYRLTGNDIEDLKNCL